MREFQERGGGCGGGQTYTVREGLVSWRGHRLSEFWGSLSGKPGLGGARVIVRFGQRWRPSFFNQTKRKYSIRRRETRGLLGQGPGRGCQPPPPLSSHPQHPLCYFEEAQGPGSPMWPPLDSDPFLLR